MIETITFSFCKFKDFLAVNHNVGVLPRLWTIINVIFRTLCSHYGLLDLQERFVSYLPLSHVAANIMDIFMATQCLGTVYFANRDALKGTLVSTLKEALPTVFFGVPRVWEKVQEKMIQVIKKKKTENIKPKV